VARLPAHAGGREVGDDGVDAVAEHPQGHAGEAVEHHDATEDAHALQGVGRVVVGVWWRVSGLSVWGEEVKFGSWRVATLLLLSCCRMHQAAPGAQRESTAHHDEGNQVGPGLLEAAPEVVVDHQRLEGNVDVRSIRQRLRGFGGGWRALVFEPGVAYNRACRTTNTNVKERAGPLNLKGRAPPPWHHTPHSPGRRHPTHLVQRRLTLVGHEVLRQLRV